MKLSSIIRSDLKLDLVSDLEIVSVHFLDFLFVIEVRYADIPTNRPDSLCPRIEKKSFAELDRNINSTHDMKT